jgi:hypothetical protein
MRRFIIFIFMGCLLLTNARADHEPDHRYNIRGYVLDASQDGVADITVQVFSEGQSIGNGKTDAEGYYSLHLHLHNADNRRVLKLRAGAYEVELQVKIDVKDSTSARIHEANLVAGKLIEGDLGRFRIPPWSYAAGGLFIFMLVAVFLEKQRKKKIRLAKYGGGEKQASSGHKKKKARHKKR